MSTTTDLSTLVINLLTEAQYQALVSGGTVEADQLYLTEEPSGLTAADVTATDSASAASNVQSLLEDTFITSSTKALYTALGWTEPS